MQIPSNTVFSERTPAEIIGSNIFFGSERVIFELEVQGDVYPAPGTDFHPEEEFFKTSPFVGALEKIICNEEVLLTGSVMTLKQELIEWGGSLEDLRSNMEYNDYSDIIDVYTYEAVPGIFSVTAKITGESDVKSLKKVDSSVLDMLYIEVITDFLVVQAQRVNKNEH